MMENIVTNIGYAIASVVGFGLLCILLYIIGRVLSMAILNSVHDHKQRSINYGKGQRQKKEEKEKSERQV